MGYLNPIQIGDRKGRHNAGKLPLSKKSSWNFLVDEQSVTIISTFHSYCNLVWPRKCYSSYGGLGVFFMEGTLMLCALGLRILLLLISSGVCVSLFSGACVIHREQKNAHTITKLNCSLHLKEVLEIFNHVINLATYSSCSLYFPVSQGGTDCF